MAYKQKNNPFKNIFSSIGNFARSKQSDVAGTISGVDITNEEIGELRRTARYNQSFRERMEARKQLRDFEKGARAGATDSDDPVVVTKEKTNTDDLRAPDGGLLPPVPGHEGDPYSYKIEDGQYFYKLGDGEWVPAKGKSLEEIQKRYGEDTSKIITDPNFKFYENPGVPPPPSDDDDDETTADETTTVVPPVDSIPTGTYDQRNKWNYDRYPQLGKYHPMNREDYVGPGPSEENTFDFSGGKFSYDKTNKYTTKK
tara:strand:- start:2 stop:769 length:768 start_codon:yes stop_codon:yes gene_type:complete